MGDFHDGVTTLILRQRQERLVEQMRSFITEESKPDTSEARKAELRTSFDAAEKDQQAIADLIERTERTEKLMREDVEKSLDNADKRGIAPKGDRRAEYRSAFKNWFVGKDLAPEERAIMSEFRGTSTQVVGTGNLGGYLVPQGFWPEITKSLKSFSGMYQAARIWETATGALTYKPTLDDTASKAVLTAESAALAVQNLTFGQKQFDAYKLTDLLKVSWEAMQDSAFDFEAEIRDAMIPRFGRAINDYTTTGTGSSQPQGVVPVATLGATAASTSVFTRPELLTLFHSVDPAYRDMPKTAWMFNDAVLRAIKALALGSNDATPLWQRSIREGEPETLEGKRFYINQSMSSTFSTAEKLILFGDFDQFVIRIVKSLEIARLNELYAGNGQVGFYGFMRFDSELLNTAAIKYLALA